MNNVKYFHRAFQVMNFVFHDPNSRLVNKKRIKSKKDFLILPYKYRFHQVIEMVDKSIARVQVKNKMLILIFHHSIMTLDLFGVFLPIRRIRVKAIFFII